MEEQLEALLYEIKREAGQIPSAVLSLAIIKLEEAIYWYKKRDKKH